MSQAELATGPERCRRATTTSAGSPSRCRHTEASRRHDALDLPGRVHSISRARSRARRSPLPGPWRLHTGPARGLLGEDLAARLGELLAPWTAAGCRPGRARRPGGRGSTRRGSGPRPSSRAGGRAGRSRSRAACPPGVQPAARTAGPGAGDAQRTAAAAGGPLLHRPAAVSASLRFSGTAARDAEPGRGSTGSPRGARAFPGLPGFFGLASRPRGALTDSSWWGQRGVLTTPPSSFRLTDRTTRYPAPAGRWGPITTRCPFMPFVHLRARLRRSSGERGAAAARGGKAVSKQAPPDPYQPQTGRPDWLGRSDAARPMAPPL